MEMLDGVAELTLDFLNEATQAWVEIEYNRAVHREISCSPVERFAQAPDVLRSSPSSDALREAFRLETTRRQRKVTGRSRWTACVSRSRLAIVTSATSWCVTPAGTSAESIWSTRAAEPFWLPSILSTAAPTPTATAARRRARRRPADASRPTAASEHDNELPPLLKKNPRRVLRHRNAAGVLAQETSSQERRSIMNAKKLLSLWGLKWNPFSPELPSEGLLVTAKIESFAWRVEQLVQEGGFALISGESGTGKSVALRIVAERLVDAA